MNGCILAVRRRNVETDGDKSRPLFTLLPLTVAVLGPLKNRMLEFVFSLFSVIDTVENFCLSRNLTWFQILSMGRRWEKNVYLPRFTSFVRMV